MGINVRHRPEQGCFETVVDGARGRVEYRVADGVMTITHTEVDAALEGQGIGSRLVRAALEHAEAEGLKVNPVCSYAGAYMKRHPETMPLHV